jgi:hypothetical protein
VASGDPSDVQYREAIIVVHPADVAYSATAALKPHFSLVS